MEKVRAVSGGERQKRDGRRGHEEAIDERASENDAGHFIPS
jgi:hypothetical protein